MQKTPATLHLLCGKIASGKSTLAKELAAQPSTVIISEDDWLAHLFPGEINAIEDYVRCAANLRNAIGPHVGALLRAGVSVVLDIPANTVATRKWMKSLFDGVQSEHLLHILETTDADCKTRLRARNAAGTHAFSVCNRDFEIITGYFVAPRQEEGFNIVRH